MHEALMAELQKRMMANLQAMEPEQLFKTWLPAGLQGWEQLQKALAASPAIQNYMVYVNVYGLGWKVEENGPVTLPGYSGTVDLKYAKPVE